MLAVAKLADLAFAFVQFQQVAIQHASSAAQSLVCSHCFRFLGELLLQTSAQLAMQ